MGAGPTITRKIGIKIQKMLSEVLKNESIGKAGER